MSNIKLKLDENIFIETCISNPNYDGVVLILYPDKVNVQLPRHLGSFIKETAALDKEVHNSATLWNCEYAAGRRLVISPTGDITPYHDSRIIYEASKRGIKRAIDAGIEKPLLILFDVIDFPESLLVSTLGALDAFYIPLHKRENNLKHKPKFKRLGLHVDEKDREVIQRVIRNGIALEIANILNRDIRNADSERMSPTDFEEYVKEAFKDDKNIHINVTNDLNLIKKYYPLLSAVSRASISIARYRPRVIEIEYRPSNLSRVIETLLFVGKGVTFDTGGVDVILNGMTGMSGEVRGAAVGLAFIKACSILKPPHLKVKAIICVCRNSIGEESFVADELLQTRDGIVVKVETTNADLILVDAVAKLASEASKELNPHIYVFSSLRGSKEDISSYTTAVDNFSARAENYASRLQAISGKIGEILEIEILRAEDIDMVNGLAEFGDVRNLDTRKFERKHQLAAAFVLKASGLFKKNIKYTYFNVNNGICDNTSNPLLGLCYLHKVFI